MLMFVSKQVIAIIRTANNKNYIFRKEEIS